MRYKLPDIDDGFEQFDESFKDELLEEVAVGLLIPADASG